MKNHFWTKLRCQVGIFLIGGALYNLIEILWRGYTHWSMFIVGGLCFQLIGYIQTALVKWGLFRRCLLCSAGGLAVIGAGRVVQGLFTGLAPLPALLRVAVPELLWSLCFVCLLYPWFSWVRRRIVKFLRL